MRAAVRRSTGARKDENHRICTRCWSVIRQRSRCIPEPAVYLIIPEYLLVVCDLDPEFSHRRVLRGIWFPAAAIAFRRNSSDRAPTSVRESSLSRRGSRVPPASNAQRARNPSNVRRLHSRSTRRPTSTRPIQLPPFPLPCIDDHWLRRGSDA